jgi:hypothetical protein
MERRLMGRDIRGAWENASRQGPFLLARAGEADSPLGISFTQLYIPAALPTHSLAIFPLMPRRSSAVSTEEIQT